MSNKLLILSILSVLAAPAVAQQMYKVVGPDGKVTFSDRPALSNAGKISIMHSYTLRPYVSAQTPGEKAAALAAKRAAEAEAMRRQPGELPVAPILSRDVEDAVISVMGQAEFSRRFYNFCNTNASSAKAFNDAAVKWNHRNAAPIAHQKQLLMVVVSPSKRDELQDKVNALLAEESAKIAARSPKERQVWCAGAVAELNSGKADIVQPEMMAVPIIQYRAK
jgi:hypothetical protein